MDFHERIITLFTVEKNLSTVTEDIGHTARDNSRECTLGNVSLLQIFRVSCSLAVRSSLSSAHSNELTLTCRDLNIRSLGEVIAREHSLIYHHVRGSDDIHSFIGETELYSHKYDVYDLKENPTQRCICIHRIQ